MDERFVPTYRIREKFNLHLGIENNERIIFSGKFGSGKTTFLNHFFYGNTQYFPIKLYPVHYSVSSNEDIFEYIKFDIIFQLLAKNVIKEGVKFSNGEIAVKFVADRLYPLLAKFIKFIPGIGKDISEILKTIIEIGKEFNEYKNNENKTVYAESLSFLKDIEKQIGNPYERNQITELINTTLSYIKDQGVKTVLLIDDFDRIDPEHIFRLLNIFASQCDTEFNSGMKFFFDHIIIVCDIDNIRNIFHHKYGTETDFTGYIDKFYSKQIFRFDIRPEFKEMSHRYFEPILKYTKIYGNEIVITGCNTILEEMIGNGDINLRHAHNIDGLTLSFSSYEYNQKVLESSTPGLIILNFFSTLLGEHQFDALINKYNSLNRMYSFDSIHRFTAGTMLELCSYGLVNITQIKRNEIFIQDYKYVLDYSVDPKRHKNNFIIKEIYYSTSNEKTMTFPFWQIMKQANDVRKFFITNGEIRSNG